MKFMQTAAVISFVVALGLGPATAHQQGKKLHLADAPLDQQVGAINYCQGMYRVVTKQDRPPNPALLGHPPDHRQLRRPQDTGGRTVAEKTPSLP